MEGKTVCPSQLSSRHYRKREDVAELAIHTFIMAMCPPRDRHVIFSALNYLVPEDIPTRAATLEKLDISFVHWPHSEIF